jgi:hypothetical protein
MSPKAITSLVQRGTYFRLSDPIVRKFPTMVAVLIPGRRGVRRDRERWLNVAKKQPPDDDAAGGEVTSVGAAKAVRTEGNGTRGCWRPGSRDAAAWPWPHSWFQGSRNRLGRK